MAEQDEVTGLASEPAVGAEGGELGAEAGGTSGAEEALQWDAEPECPGDLAQKEEMAAAWLRDHPAAQLDTGALFAAFLTVPYTKDLDEHHTKHVANNERLLHLTFGVGRERSLPFLLSPEERLECECANVTGLGVERIYLSGSVREGSEVRLYAEQASDMDVMFQLGKVQIVRSAAEAAGLQSRSSLVLISEPLTQRPGYMLLNHPHTASCTHWGRRLAFSGRRARTYLSQFGTTMSKDSPDQCGPAVNSRLRDVFGDNRSIDLVPCLLYPNWNSNDYSSRERPAGQPSPDLVARLCATPAFVVPVGFPGSATEEDEFRLSFSRHEYIVYRSLSQDQRRCLIALKYCKAIVGEELAPVKSYYLKTGLMWLCEARPEPLWRPDNMYESLQAVLRFLQVCLERRYMPCYFWPEIDLLASRDQDELAQLAAALAHFQQHVLSSVLALVADWTGQEVEKLAHQLTQPQPPPTEQQVWSKTANNVARLLLHKKFVPLKVLKDLALTGKWRPRARLLPYPLCSSVPLLVQALKSSMDAVPDYESPDEGDEDEEVRAALLPARQLRQLAIYLQCIGDVMHDIRSPDQAVDSWLEP